VVLRSIGRRHLSNRFVSPRRKRSPQVELYTVKAKVKLKARVRVSKRLSESRDRLPMHSLVAEKVKVRNRSRRVRHV